MQFASILIPVFDDTDELSRLLETLTPEPEDEIVVINGGAPDPRLVALTHDRPGVSLLSSPPGRGRQMNAGASSAGGRWFLFLHADTRLPATWRDELRRADQDASIVAGSFRFRLDSEAWQARVIERGVRWRVRWCDLAYGDQALFVRRDAFRAIGGYREWPLMEDVDLVRRLRRVGRMYHSPVPVVTSARRWERDGWWRRSAENVILQSLFLAGVSPGWLARRYERHGRIRATREALVVMARAPSDARGKSRLTRGAPGDPIELRRAILLDTLDVVRRVSRAELFVVFEPAEALTEFLALTASPARLVLQHGDTLGDRMRNAFSDLFGRGYSSVVMIGSDVPTLPATYVEQAFDRLRDDRKAVVIGPAIDGGYYLIGLHELTSELFESMPWGTPDVLSTTLKTARKLRLPVSLTPEWYDVDRPDDLRRVVNEPAGAVRTRSWVAKHSALVADQVSGSQF